ncbi:MAG: hypothetical protein QF921_04995 [Pseudomonadales bacterium]|jgi:hypothetical protein|nr:hypothetical protein [Pseudomonadales bacterium]MDP6471867.1 hypothetical protein [Pseudomonadales bacterium]MDP6826863.1 hypothetical protein [Pseudomonadales bacterium]MDP6970859.1 hypothetical protein [Pseudomonadales bacterium]|tara:strand:+ start:1053 stop:1358 length:306 start_codon:yes stop_codon:yes gene_type:complete
MNENTWKTLIAITAFALTATAYANPTICTNWGLIRSVEVVYGVEGQAVPCEVIYAKRTEGTTQSLWRANNEEGYCEARAIDFIKQLESSGWDCDSEGTSED